MTDAPRAQSVQSDAEWLRDLARGYANAGSVAPELSHLLAIADALEDAMAERKWIAAIRKEGPLRRIDELEQQLAATRAERDALAALVDEVIRDSTPPRPNSSVVFHFKAWLSRAKALRAPQTGGENDRQPV